MILALNHLQQLNGNKMKKTLRLLFLFVACQINFTSTNAYARTTSQKPIHVAFLLPFNTARLSYDTLGSLIGKLPASTQMAIQYYRGALLALDSLSNDGFQIVSHFYDTQGDTSIVRDILFNRIEMLSMQLIIGPFYIDELRIANRFSERFKVPVISPYATTTSFIQTNPFYILSKPSLPTHCKTMFEYAINKYNPSKLIFLYTSTEQDKNYYTLFENAWKESAIQPKLYALTDSTKITYKNVDTYLQSGVTNVVIIPSTNETFISNMTAHLDSLVSIYNIVIVGMPQWRESQTLKVNQLSRLNCILSHYTRLNKSGDFYKRVATQYTNLYGSTFSDYSIDGYNDTYYFVKTFASNSYHIDYSFPEESVLGKNIVIKPKYKTSNESENKVAAYYEDIEVKLMQYHNGRLEDIP